MKLKGGKSKEDQKKSEHLSIILLEVTNFLFSNEKKPPFWSGFSEQDKLCFEFRSRLKNQQQRA